jgi:hypothetical protein
MTWAFRVVVAVCRDSSIKPPWPAASPAYSRVYLLVTAILSGIGLGAFSSRYLLTAIAGRTRRNNGYVAICINHWLGGAETAPQKNGISSNRSASSSLCRSFLIVFVYPPSTSIYQPHL